MENFAFAWLDRETYEGYPLKFSYRTDRHYRVTASQWSMSLREELFPEPAEKAFTDELFGDWLEAPVALGAFLGEELAGVIEGSVETWHNVFRISNLLILEPYRKAGLGTALMDRMLAHAKSLDCRGVILETQSCNYPAISFYRKQGFTLSRIDLREYHNDDILRGEVRLDFFLAFSQQKEG